MRSVFIFVGLIFLAGVIALLIQNKQRDVYIDRAVIANAYASAAQIKLRVEEYFYENGELPNSNYSLDLPEPHEFRLRGLKALAIEDNGVIHVEIEGESPQASGHIFLLPQQLDDHVSERWICLTPSYPSIEKWMPQCRYEPVEGW